MHRIISELTGAKMGEPVVIGGDEAAHAVRVKRMEVGERVELMDGRGRVAAGIVQAVRAGRNAEIVVVPERIENRPPVSPRVEVWSATPKGGRVDELVEGLSQVGAAAWVPLRTERSVVLPRDTKVERLRRVAVESAKQAGRAWVMEIGEEKRFDESLRGGVVVMADGSGEAYTRTGAMEIRLLVGPEGGWTEAEVAAAQGAGVRVCSFGPHVMRIETAGVVGCAGIIGMES